MFRKLRWRVTLWFMLLAGLVYLINTGVGQLIFRYSLNDSMEDEAEALYDEIRPALTVFDGNLSSPASEAKHWESITFKQPVSIQIFDSKQKMIHTSGLNGDERLFLKVVETVAEDGGFRSRSFPVVMEGKTVGYVQVQISTKHRDNSLKQYVLSMAWLAPVVLMALAFGGYVFSGKAVEPVEQSYLALKSFLADAGHELGTPLAIIQASADNLSLDIEDDASAKERVDVITRTTERMNRLVGDMSMLAKLKATQFVEKREGMISLDVLVRDLVNDFEDLFEEKQITINCKVESVHIHGDPQELAKVVSNLMQNAYRYTDGGGTVTVSLSLKDGKATLAVKDSGVGISSEDLPHIFDRFYRVDKSRSRAQGGSGLGLAIVQAVVEGHKGTIAVTSELEKGTTFTITFPSATA